MSIRSHFIWHTESYRQFLFVLLLDSWACRRAALSKCTVRSRVLHPRQIRVRLFGNRTAMNGNETRLFQRNHSICLNTLQTKCTCFCSKTFDEFHCNGDLIGRSECMRLLVHFVLVFRSGASLWFFLLLLVFTVLVPIVQLLTVQRHFWPLEATRTVRTRWRQSDSRWCEAGTHAR